MWELILSFRQEMGVNIRVNIQEREISSPLPLSLTLFWEEQWLCSFHISDRQIKRGVKVGHGHLD